MLISGNFGAFLSAFLPFSRAYYLDFNYYLVLGFLFEGKIVISFLSQISFLLIN
jgi:hypothetical protein